MTTQEFSTGFWPQVRGLWPRWQPTETETLAWSRIMRPYGIRSATAAAQAYWEEDERQIKPIAAKFMRHLRYQPEASDQTDREQAFAARYHGMGMIGQRLVDQELCRRRLAANRYDGRGGRERDERLIANLERFCERQERISGERLRKAEAEADEMLARFGRRRAAE